VAEFQARNVGETQRLFRPLVATLEWVVARIGWIVGVVAALYVASGVTFVRANEVALVLRFGRLVGSTPAEQVHGPGLLLALPFPIDRVERVPMDRVREVRVDTLDASDEVWRDDPLGATQGDRIDPRTEGYTLTGDRFVMQTRLVARYRVRDALAFALESSAEQREILIHDAVQAAAAEAITHYQSFELVEGLTTLPLEVRERAQARLDELDTGVELVEVALRRMTYPRQVLEAVRSVVDAQSEALTFVQLAEARRRQELQGVVSALEEWRAGARAYADELVFGTRGTLEAYAELAPQYREAPRLVRDRLLRSGLARVLRERGPSSVLFPGPANGVAYPELRISMSPRRSADTQNEGEAED
jgi:membrane protease subunit HflK